MKLQKYQLVLFFFSLFSIQLLGQVKNDDSIKPIIEVLIEGKYRDLERLPTLEGTRINSGKKNEVINCIEVPSLSLYPDNL